MAQQFNQGGKSTAVMMKSPVLTRMAERNIPISKQRFPGKDSDMPEPKPIFDKLPEAGGEAATYKASGKLKGKKALITGGDSGIGAATAILFAREGAECVIAYLADEEKDAQNTKTEVEQLGSKCHLFSTDLRTKENCQKTVDFAVEKMGGIDVLFNNCACGLTRRDATGTGCL